ncbi:MAG: hypothetical protein KGJ02_01075 [Verrucomicrobiota bacterium]|nr:hypothetical protein [Verrucomicrobiota bacterium]
MPRGAARYFTTENTETTEATKRRKKRREIFFAAFRRLSAFSVLSGAIFFALRDFSFSVVIDG